jgi:hypothetical protein
MKNIDVVKNIPKLLFGILLSLSSVSLATAGSDTYLGGGIGQSSLDISDSSADRIDDSSTYFKIFGGKKINESVNSEFGYVDFGEFSAHYPTFDETDKADGFALYAAAVGATKIAENINVIGRIGLNYWSIDISADANVFGTPVSGSGDGTGISLLFGFGLEISLGSESSIRLEFERFNNVADGIDVTFPGFGSVEVDGEDIDLLGVSLVHNFQM